MHTLQLAVRRLLRERFFTLLNIVGLAISLASAILLFLWIQDELSFDRFHSKSDRIFRVLNQWTFSGKPEWTANTPAPLADEARQSVTGMEAIVRTWHQRNKTATVGGNTVNIAAPMVADADFFDIFDFDFLVGTPQTALSDPGNVVLTEATARRLFGKIPEQGAVFEMAGYGNFAVGGVIKNIVSNSSLQFDCLLTWEGAIPRFVKNPANSFHWGQFSYTTWVLAAQADQRDQIARSLSAIAAKHRTGKDAIYFSLQNIADIHMYSDFINWGQYGSWKTVQAVGLIGLLLLFIGCINYLNLASARAVSRAKIIGVQKAIGANSLYLFRQSMAESGLTILGALALSVFFIALVLPAFEAFVDKKFGAERLINVQTAALVLGTAVAAWIGSGIQPAVQLARFRPVEVLKGQTFGQDKTAVRKFLLTTQFVVSVALGICALVISQQLRYVQRADLGYQREHIFSFFMPEAKADLLKNELLGAPGVAGVAATDNQFVQLGSQCGGDDWEGKQPNQPSVFWQINVDPEFLAFFGLQLKEGRWFRPGASDSLSFVLNESAVKAMQMEHPIGKWMDHGGVRGTIVGIARDFHFQSLHSPIEPMIFNNFDGHYRVAYVKTAAGDGQKAIESVKKAYSNVFPGKILEYHFLDEQYDLLYQTEARTGKLVGLFTLLTLVVSCIGLFGLAAYSAVRRTREIGIRKVLGATVSGIAALLAKDFIKLVVLAIFIASPIAYYFMRGWLADFAFHTEMAWWNFALPGGLAIGIAFITVSIQGVKVGLANPVKSLKTE